MFHQMKKWFWKFIFATVNFFLCLSILGCGMVPATGPQTHSKEGMHSVLTRNPKDEEEILSICQPLYEEVDSSQSLDFEQVRRILKALGTHGYAAIDLYNQIDMTNPEQVLHFYESVTAEAKDSLTIIAVGYSFELFIYELENKNGKIDIIKGLYRYDKGTIRTLCRYHYQADWIKYTQEGYFFFSGVCYSEEFYVLSLSGVEEYTAFRVQPLDERCRELNRKYLLPIGYERNNLFLIDWNEGDYGALDFYDVFDRCYPLVNAQENPYVMADDLGIGAVYRIPRMEFEQVVMAYFPIDSQTLQSKTIYHAEDDTYEYKPRGFYEVEYPSYPYSEVTAFTEHDDGTITLEVHAVFPDKGLSKVFSHEVVVRPLEDGGMQYLSNQIQTWEKGYEAIWYTPRLTEEEWEETYGKVE